MAAKRLQRLDISDDLKDRLRRQNLTTCTDVLNKSLLELMKLSGCCGLTVQDLVHRCCMSQAVKPVTALDLLKSREMHSHFLATALPDLDKVLHGGIPASTITEVAGPAGCGKTQLSLTLTVLATLPTEAGGLGGGVLYIDTEGAFSAKRLLEIAQSRLPHYHDDAHLKELASQVHVISVQSCRNLIARLENIEEDIISKRIKLVILDSVASLVRKEYSNVQGGMMRRTDFLVAEAALLKYIAETFSIPVIVTNQVTTRYGEHPPLVSPRHEDGASSSAALVEVDGEGSYLTAALGNTWSHSVNTRLILQYLTGDRRQILVAKSPIAPFTCFDFVITKKGVEQDGGGHDTFKQHQSASGCGEIGVTSTPIRNGVLPVPEEARDAPQNVQVIEVQVHTENDGAPDSKYEALDVEYVAPDVQCEALDVQPIAASQPQEQKTKMSALKEKTRDLNKSRASKKRKTPDSDLWNDYLRSEIDKNNSEIDKNNSEIDKNNEFTALAKVARLWFKTSLGISVEDSTTIKSKSN